MKYQVIWKPKAEKALTSIWIDAPDRASITQAADAIDYLLQLDPESRGESREGSLRVLIVPPLVAYFKPIASDRTVFVISLRLAPKRPLSEE